MFHTQTKKRFKSRRITNFPAAITLSPRVPQCPPHSPIPGSGYAVNANTRETLGPLGVARVPIAPINVADFVGNMRDIKHYWFQSSCEDDIGWLIRLNWAAFIFLVEWTWCRIVDIHTISCVGACVGAWEHMLCFGMHAFGSRSMPLIGELCLCLENHAVEKSF